jgi:voltage-dependent calcium channel L type alpha-1D
VNNDQGGNGDAADGETGEGNDEEGDDDDDDATGGEDRHVRMTAEGPTARPRRLSELNTPNKIRPIPPSSSLFLFAQNNR